MRIILAGPRGFCAGVNMAIESLRRALHRFGPPVYVYHEIVHNRWVVDGFRAEGAVFVDDLGAMPEGATLLFSAHGVTPEVRREAARRQLRIIDATCPLVTKVHREARRFSEKGYSVVLIGHAGHDEVVGTMGEAPEAMVLVESLQDVERLTFADTAKVACLTQTTLSVHDAALIVERLRQRYPQIVGPPRDDICYATQNRQETVRRLAVDADRVLVVGSRNSSNSRRLAELARHAGVPAFLVDGPADIDPGWFAPGNTVLVTAGASAPEHVVQQCVGLLQNHFGATVESCAVCEERVRFPLPEALADHSE